MVWPILGQSPFTKIQPSNSRKSTHTEWLLPVAYLGSWWNHRLWLCPSAGATAMLKLRFVSPPPPTLTYSVLSPCLPPMPGDDVLHRLIRFCNRAPPDVGKGDWGWSSALHIDDESFSATSWDNGPLGFRATPKILWLQWAMHPHVGKLSSSTWAGD